ncbi:hypothetical protein [Micromonospora echinospora]|uniref:hypothetical protein n=1 Tax=Micromonospora echinospora TaxID=1877 RepID=UPI0012FD6EDC|nr:hypothetical protein [Micromonospora echinospora]
MTLAALIAPATYAGWHAAAGAPSVVTGVTAAIMAAVATLVAASAARRRFLMGSFRA